MVFRALILFISLIAVTNILSQNFPRIENGVSKELAEWRAQNYSDVRYRLDLTIGKKASTIKGTIEVTVDVSGMKSVPEAVATGSKPIILDWRKIRGHEKLSRISNVSINGKPIEKSAASVPGATGYHEINEHLVFKEGVKSGTNVIKLDFESPILTSGSAVTRYIDKTDGSEYIYSLFVPSDASTAFPVFDQPDLKARFKLRIITPKDWTVVSNYPELSEEYNSVAVSENLTMVKPIRVSNRLITEFEESKPISTYVFAFAAGPFRRVSMIDPEGERLPVSISFRKSQASKMKEHIVTVSDLTERSIKYLESYFDYKFPFPKYDLVLIPEFPFGGMEHAGATFLRESSIIFPTEPTANNYISRAQLLFHENAHQWFGDTVTMKWFDDLWLKEGFATFMAYKARENVMHE